MQAARAASSWRFRMNLEFQCASSAPANTWTISRRWTLANLSRTCCSLEPNDVGQAIKAAIPPEETVRAVEATGLRGFLAKFTVLKGAQRELWLTFLIK